MAHSRTPFARYSPFNHALLGALSALKQERREKCERREGEQTLKASARAAKGARKNKYRAAKWRERHIEVKAIYSLLNFTRNHTGGTYMNYFEQFYNFLTYNPDNIPITYFIPHLSVYCLAWAILLFLTSWMFSNKFSFWLIARSVIWAPYMVFYIFWILCFLGEGFLPNSIPLLPILLCLGASIVWKKYNKHHRTTEQNTITT